MKTNRLEPTHVIIPVDTAIERTKNWRNYINSVENFPDKSAKGVYISRTDILDLAAYLTLDESLLGVRAYFALNNDYTEFPPDQNEIRLVMVLVKDTTEAGYPNGEDLLTVPDNFRSLRPTSDDPTIGDSNVYDFTRPCPDCCDLRSPLFGPQE
jgi:hypothetical protein